MTDKLSAEELGLALNEIACGCREPEVVQLARIQDHIAALTAEAERMREALKRLANPLLEEDAESMRAEARAALKEQPTAPECSE